MLSKKIRITIKEILKNDFKARDNDMYLLSLIWKKDIEELLYYEYDYIHAFFNLLAYNKLTNPETVRRARQLLQRAYPELRGSSYEVRHKKSIKVKEEINTIQFEEFILSKYLRINKAILETLQQGSEIYCSKVDENNTLILGKKYEIQDISRYTAFPFFLLKHIEDFGNKSRVFLIDHFSILKP